MQDEKIITKGNWFEARMMTMVQTCKIFEEKLEEHPDSTIDMSLYCRDVKLLLTMLDKAGEELYELRKNKRIIT